MPVTCAVVIKAQGFGSGDATDALLVAAQRVGAIKLAASQVVTLRGCKRITVINTSAARYAFEATAG
jgi:hypothetical protein